MKQTPRPPAPPLTPAEQATVARFEAAGYPAEVWVAEVDAAYNEGRWCGMCTYGVVMEPPCCLQPEDDL